MVSKGASARTKGHDFEREIVKEFRPIFGNEVRRGVQARSGKEAPDVETPVFWVECKRMKRTNPKQVLEQACRDVADRRIPIGVCKDDYKDPFVVIRLDDFLEVIREWWELGNE
jgi:hypothetical protein